MPLAALGLVLVAALVHAGWNALAKSVPQRLSLLWLAMLLGGPMALALALVSGIPLIPEHGRVLLLLSALVHAGYFYALSRAYQADLSLAYPLARGLAVGVAPLAAWALLGERVSPAGAAGIICVVAGGMTVGLSGKLVAIFRPTRARPDAGGAADAGDEADASKQSGMRWALVGGVLVATYSLLDAEGSRRVHPLTYLGWMGMGSALVMLPLMRSRRRQLAELWRGRRAVVAAVAVMSLGAYLLVLAAFRLASTGYVVACRELSIVASVLFGWLWLRESHWRTRLMGALLIVAGAAVITLFG